MVREARVYRRLWRGSLFSSFVQPVLYLGAMGFGLGGLVRGDTDALGGLSYLHFVAPGLLAATAMQAAAGESLWPVMAGTKWNRTFFAMVATPVRPGDVYAGHVAWAGVRTGLAVASFLVVAALVGAVPSAWGVLALPAAVLCALAFAAPLTAFAATQETDVPFAVIMRLGVLPLFLFSGAFFPIEQLPDRLEPLAKLSPLWHGVELCRDATTGQLHAGDLGHVAFLLACVAAGAAWGVHTFGKRLTP